MSATKLELNPTATAPDYPREQIFDHYRRWGYLEAQLDPLGQYLTPEPIVEAGDLSGPGAEDARRYYCGTVGAEFMHIPSAERRRWIQERMEVDPPELSQDVQQRILEDLTRADIFEQVIQSRYLGTKRF